MNYNESKYATVAMQAAEAATKGIHPVEAWEAAAARAFPNSPTGERKGCPRSTFLGLAEAGQIIDIAPGNYTTSKDNKRYAMAALKLLRDNKSSSHSPIALWSRVMELEGSKKTHNSQMDVVTALWQAKKFVGQSA